MDTCIFCKIIDKKIPAKIIYEDKEFLSFHDINPQAPVHILIIPKKHIASINNLTDADELIMAKLHRLAQKLAGDLKVAQTGYRLVINNGQDAGQAVAHLHLHLLGGRTLQWPPG